MIRINLNLLLALVVSLWLPVSQLDAAQAARLEELIEGARKEGSLNVMLPGTATPELVRGLEAAMNKYYGLNLKVSHSGPGSYTKAAAIAVTEHRTGTRPTFDATIGGTEHMMEILDAGALEPIPNWRDLLPKGAPLDDPSIVPRVLNNTCFKFVDNFHIVIYNTKLISKEEMPKRLADYGNPKYKEKFAVPPFLTTVSMAMLTHGREKALEIYRTWGKNNPKVLTYNNGVDRIVFGEIAFMPYPNEYDYFAKKAAGDPVGMTVIQDFVPWTPRYMGVRTNARHPNAAKLWVLFNAGPEAQRLWEKEVKWINASYPKQSQADEVQKMLKETGAKVVAWEDNDETIAHMRWFATTKEGREYQSKLRDALHITR